MTIFASTPPINDDPEPWTCGVFHCERHAERGSELSSVLWLLRPRPVFDRPRAHEANPILVEFRTGHDYYDFLFDLDSRWAGEFTEAERYHAVTVLDRWRAVFG